MMSAAKTLPYSAQPCAQLTYQPRPDLTPTVSATINVRNDVPRPIKSPMKILGNAAGIATRKIRYFCPAPRVRATSRYDERVLAIPETVSMVTGNHTARATNPTAAQTPEGESTMAKGTQAVAGIGPTIFKSGIPQYRAWANQPMHTPVTSPTETPKVYPASSRANECQVLSNRSRASFNKLCSTVAGLGK